LIELNYKRNTSSFFGESYAFSRDPEHFKKIINEFQRFYFLYPDSLYLTDARQYLDKSVDALAEHETLIGKWYFQQSLYAAAISRFRFILYNYPNFPKKELVVELLAESYRRNQQDELADELEEIFRLSQQNQPGFAIQLEKNRPSSSAEPEKKQHSDLTPIDGTE